jgi:hypothetical protein
MILNIFINVISFFITLILSLGYSIGVINFNQVAFGSYYTEDVSEYGEYVKKYEAPDFLPDTLDDVTVVKYCYTAEAYFSRAVEIYLEVTVPEENFDDYIKDIMDSEKSHNTKTAYYDSSYIEIIFKDDYEIYEYEEDEMQMVGIADVQKVIYSPETYTVIFECLYVDESAVLYLDQVVYFARFEIDEYEYVNQSSGTEI